MREIFVVSALALLFSGIAYIFWLEEYQYSLPTPIPIDYEEVAIGSCIDLPDRQENFYTQQGRFLHFFNPDCPCSRFNALHFRSLFQQFGSQLDFSIVIPEGSSAQKTRDLLGEHISVIEDREGLWSSLTGVYSSPQAVILDCQGNLYYRGNYNKARFCTLPGSNYAEISLNLFVKGQAAPQWDYYATHAYGCQLPESGYNPLSFLFDSKEKQTIPSIWKTKASN